MSALVVDASVALKWFLPEPDTEDALRLISGPMTLLAPDLIWSELANAVWKRIRIGEADTALWTELAANLPKIMELKGVEADVLAGATGLALEFSHPVYDCQYLALALNTGARVVTTDRRFLQAFRQTRHGDRIVSLGDMALPS